MEGDFERASFYTLGRRCEAHMHNVYEEPSHRGAADDGGEQHLVLKGASDDVLEEMVTINLLAPARLMLLGVRLFPAIADRLLGSEQGQARIHING